MTDTWGWIAIVAVPVAFWVLIIGFVVIVFGRYEPIQQFESAEQVDPVEVDEPVTEPVRETTPVSSGLGWRPPVPSHH